MPDKESDNSGLQWWINFHLQALPQGLVEEEEDFSEGDSEPDSSKEFSQLMASFDLIKFYGLGEYKITGGDETFQTVFKTDQLKGLSSETRQFLMQEEEGDKLVVIFGYERDVTRTITLEINGRKVKFVLDKNKKSCRYLKQEFLGRKWFSLENFELEDLESPIFVAELGVKEAESKNGSGSS